MKKIQPVCSYRGDGGYPSDAEHDQALAAPGATRRGFLGALAAGAGAAALGVGLVALPRSARAEGAPVLPGRPPLPDPRRRRASNTTAGTGTACAKTVTLAPRFLFCGGTYGQVAVESNDVRLVATLALPDEAAPQRRLILPVLQRGGSCGWLQDARAVALREETVAAALRAHYAQVLRAPVAALKVQLLIIPPAAPRRRDLRPPPGVPPRPHRGCASCSTAAEPADLLVPAGLTAFGLYLLRRRD